MIEVVKPIAVVEKPSDVRKISQAVFREVSDIPPKGLHTTCSCGWILRINQNGASPEDQRKFFTKTLKRTKKMFYYIAYQSFCPKCGEPVEFVLDDEDIFRRLNGLGSRRLIHPRYDAARLQKMYKELGVILI